MGHGRGSLEAHTNNRIAVATCGDARHLAGIRPTGGHTVDPLALPTAASRWLKPKDLASVREAGDRLLASALGSGRHEEAMTFALAPFKAA